VCVVGRTKGGQRSQGLKGWIRRIGTWALRLGLGFLGLTGVLVLFFRFVPVPGSTLMLERRWTAWREGEPYASRHAWRPLEEISPAMGVAVIAAEDQLFADHFGFDWNAIEKAVAHNERSRRKRGASTLTQQTAKNLFLWPSRSWVRKGFEAWFTLALELGWSKRRILEVYLNIVEFGDGIYGVEAAAQTYFRKPAKHLSASEAALLAAVLPNPHRFKVAAPSEYIRGRQAWILRQMEQLGGAQVVRDLGK
jgi:monofunctional biosynthetic peptidoglycan transglycosylase